METPRPHKNESHGGTGAKMNWLRAGVLGANDGIVSTACIVLGVIAAGSDTSQIVLAGIAAAVAGAVSMALGEYVSVSAQRDTEHRLIELETHELRDMPEEEHHELVGILQGYGVSSSTAESAAREIEAKDPLSAHLRLELGIDSEDLTSPWAAAISSAIAFTAGALLPLLSVLIAAHGFRGVVVTVVTLLTLALTGVISARLSDTNLTRSVLRLLIGGAIGLAVTYGAGHLFGTFA
ncbi:VIT1/CCC1 transporter family protein [Corynebacterium heidelbergense]|uniref:VIT1/CCC1 transporter family protein n=1 Tax=Corynebacterium heidelbergense TaxID=2055947 RepID=UPI003F68A43A